MCKRLRKLRRLRRLPRGIQPTIAADITDEQRRTWARGTPSDWAMESFGLARDHAYGLLHEPSNEVYALDDSYISAAGQDVRLQLQRAGVRLAVMLSRALDHFIERPRR